MDGYVILPSYTDLSRQHRAKSGTGYEPIPIGLTSLVPRASHFSALPGWSERGGREDKKPWERECGLPGHQLRSAMKVETAALSSCFCYLLSCRCFKTIAKQRS